MPRPLSPKQSPSRVAFDSSFHGNQSSVLINCNKYNIFRGLRKGDMIKKEALTG